FDLLSFPTRRASDLRRSTPASARPATRPVIQAMPVIPPPPSTSPRVMAGRVLGRRGPLGPTSPTDQRSYAESTRPLVGTPVPAVERKSTRLNSSHVK